MTRHRAELLLFWMFYLACSQIPSLQAAYWHHITSSRYRTARRVRRRSFFSSSPYVRIGRSGVRLVTVKSQCAVLWLPAQWPERRLEMPRRRNVGWLGPWLLAFCSGARRISVPLPGLPSPLQRGPDPQCLVRQLVQTEKDRRRSRGRLAEREEVFSGGCKTASGATTRAHVCGGTYPDIHSGCAAVRYCIRGCLAACVPVHAHAWSLRTITRASPALSVACSSSRHPDHSRCCC